MSHYLCFLYPGKSVCIEHLFPEAPVEPFYVAILMWFTLLDKL